MKKFLALFLGAAMLFGVFAAVSVPESLERTTNSLEMARFPYGNIR